MPKHSKPIGMPMMVAIRAMPTIVQGTAQKMPMNIIQHI